MFMNGQWTQIRSPFPYAKLRDADLFNPRKCPYTDQVHQETMPQILARLHIVARVWNKSRSIMLLPCLFFLF